MYFAKKEKYVFYRCSICFVIFMLHNPSPERLRRYYASHFVYDDGNSNELRIRKRSNVILNDFQLMMPKAKTLCDVGSGYGFFLDEAKKTGYQCTGIEPSRYLSALSGSRYSIQIFRGELKEYVRKKHMSYDIVTCIHVVEHVAKPREFILHLLSLVKPGGLLYIETPNSDSHLLYGEKEQYTFLIPPEHLWIFSKKTIKNLLPTSAGIVKVNTYSYPEHLMGIIKTVISTPRLKRSKSNKVNQISSVPALKSDMLKIKKYISYFIIDRTFAPLFTWVLNLNHKGSILELYIKVKSGKSGL